VPLGDYDSQDPLERSGGVYAFHDVGLDELPGSAQLALEMEAKEKAAELESVRMKAPISVGAGDSSLVGSCLILRPNRKGQAKPQEKGFARRIELRKRSIETIDSDCRCQPSFFDL
jgi:hypothetical protein